MSIIQKNILRMKQVQEATGLSKSTIYLFIRQGKFKKPIRLGQNSVGWLSSDIEEFINARVTASRPE
ncbi:AlpA family transcriptional regulator [Oxalobacter formigenes]|uniref:helix-turn-helix transcriptional regulator n=1 Tax=Oxalobacter formigenes TaxID=847 RepID=UPI0022AEABB7|nr:AlpA family transcriptional regulator [Oxalobacter formigenes]WAW05093.1 AlpA family transcriptional regulator [Oxalobacter formigenes]